MEVETEVQAEIVEGVGEMKSLIAVVVKIAHGRAADIIASRGPHDSSTEDKIKIEVANAAPNLLS